MTVRSLNDAIFRLGRVSADRNLTNTTLLQSLADVVIDTLGVDITSLSVFERGVDGSATASYVRGPWTEADRDRFLEQTGWQFDDRGLAARLASLRRGRLYHRPDLMTDPEAAVADAAPGDHAAALYRRSDGVELLLAIHRAQGAGPFPRTTLARAGALAPFVAQCWAASWTQEPAWMRGLKPVSRRILEDLLGGYDDDQIAGHMSLSYHSVRAHLKRLFREAGVRSRLHLMQVCRPMRDRDVTLTVEIPSDDPARQATG